MTNPESEAPARLRGLYERYLREVEQLELNRKPGAGYFGIKGGVADDPCHERFAEALRGFYTDFAAGEPSSAAARELMACACTLPKEAETPRAAFWMLLAVQGLTLPLVGLLDASDAAALCALYESTYRRSERLPVQIKLIKALKARA